MEAIEIIKDNLNRQKIKLWLAPYLEEDGQTAIKPLQKLAQDLSLTLSLPEDLVVESLKILQRKAVDNFKERENFKETGIATLKIRSPIKIGEIINVSLKLTENGKELKRLVAESLNDSSDRLKIIGKGKVIVDDLPLEQQGVKHGMQLMTLLLRGSVDELQKFEANDALLSSTKRDIGLLSDSIARNGENYLQITDQSGKPLSLPPGEQKALVLAMTLHEKARSAMKDENFSVALFLLLEAEKEFSHCNSKLLEQVDNYGLLNLDVAWCYLCLQSFNLLPDAHSRLMKCEQVFQKTYGNNMERLMAVKGSTVSEGALYLRLHLLQAIVHYHQNQFDLARERLKQVEDELKGLKIDDETLSQILDLGYTLTESRVALRESKGNINIAVSIIENKRAEREKIERAAKKEREINKERKKLGKCKDGSWVEPEFHKALLSMGYSSATAAWALSETNNNISNAVSLIQEHPERLPPAPISIPDDAVSQLIALGFDAVASAAALNQHAGNLDSALDQLVKSGGNGMLALNELLPLPSTSKAGTSQSTSAVTQFADSVIKKLKKTAEAAKEEENAYSRVAEGLTDAADDYLDLALTTEEQFLLKYKDLLAKQDQTRYFPR